jgi:glycerol-3-phosphate dehydrogenase (NAD(P)+)
MSPRVAVVGAGSWGTTVAHLCAQNTETALFARHATLADEINHQHRNSTYLPGFDLGTGLRATSSLAEVARSADVLVMAVPTVGFRATLKDLRDHVRQSIPVVSLAKGFEASTAKRMSELVHDELPGHPVGVLTGPNLAKEILAGQAAASVLAFPDPQIADQLQSLFATPLFRVYSSADVIGCEIGGAVKNVMALAAGMALGLGTGDNTRAAVITRGLAEMTRLGVALGGEPSTFAGLAGMGDLLATCMSDQSRNRHVGRELGRGRPLDEVLAGMDQVAEGISSAAIVHQLARQHDVYMPIAEQVYACIEHRRSPLDAFAELMRNPATREVESN